ncbi:MAG: zinc-ribbon domain-containing protein [Crenarchaeota archaeon]|nr:zinc-ribbon domain-containing protein [Thermoproteota archaeon]
MKISFYEYCIESGREYLLAEWDPVKNGSRTPQNTAKNSRCHIWWKCSNGHKWQTQAASRLFGTGCPECYRIKRAETKKKLKQGE